MENPTTLSNEVDRLGEVKSRHPYPAPRAANFHKKHFALISGTSAQFSLLLMRRGEFVLRRSPSGG
jgi:hypothetical protein